MLRGLPVRVCQVKDLAIRKLAAYLKFEFDQTHAHQYWNLKAILQMFEPLCKGFLTCFWHIANEAAQNCLPRGYIVDDGLLLWLEYQEFTALFRYFRWRFFLNPNAL